MPWKSRSAKKPISFGDANGFSTLTRRFVHIVFVIQRVLF
jgi:hypothetical protein